MNKPLSYIVAGTKPWCRNIFEAELANLPGTWRFVSDPQQLDAALLGGSPRYIFFMHWSSLVPERITNGHECVCFHMTDVPFGRGGSPLQNLISRGILRTKLTAMRMVREMDAGPVYFKEDLSLEGSTAEEIYIRASRLSAAMIRQLAAENTEPQPQRGEPVVFKRRKPDQSRIEKFDSLLALHDHIRMLDAEGYPAAFLESCGFRFEFKRSALYDGRIEASVVISPIKGPKK